MVNLAFFIFSSSQAAKTILTPAQVTEIIVSTAVIPISHEIKLPINAPVVSLSRIHLSDPGNWECGDTIVIAASTHPKIRKVEQKKQSIYMISFMIF